MACSVLQIVQPLFGCLPCPDKDGFLILVDNATSPATNVAYGKHHCRPEARSRKDRLNTVSIFGREMGQKHRGIPDHHSKPPTAFLSPPRSDHDRFPAFLATQESLKNDCFSADSSWM